MSRTASSLTAFVFALVLTAITFQQAIAVPAATALPLGMSVVA